MKGEVGRLESGGREPLTTGVVCDSVGLVKRNCDVREAGGDCGASKLQIIPTQVRVVALVALLSLLAVASSMAAGDAYEAYRSQFVGTWKTQREQRVTTVTWRGDGTWESETVDAGKVLFKMSGVWWTHEAKLHGVCLTSSDPDISRGEDEASPVLEVTEDHYVIRNSRSIEKKYTRVKANG